jgi:hypothetical protein
MLSNKKNSVTSSKNYGASLQGIEQTLARFLLILGFFWILGHSVAPKTLDNLKLPWICPFRVITGHPCQGCGMTDATRSLLKGKILEAFKINPNVFPLWGWLAATALLPGHVYRKLQAKFKKWRIFEIWLVLALLWWLKGF